MSRNNLSKGTPAGLAKHEDATQKKLVRAVHAVAMRHAVEGTAVEEILAEKVQSVQEFTFQLYVRNAFEAKPGTKEGRECAKALMQLLDGNDDPANGVIVPVTYVQRQKVDENQEKEVAITIPTRMQLQGDTNE